MIPFLKKENIRQLTLFILLSFLFTCTTLPLHTQAQTACKDNTVSDGDSQPITISRVWQSTLYDIPFTYDMALNDTAGYAQVLANMNEFAESFAGIYEQNGSMDYCTLETVWNGYNTNDGKLPETLSVSAGDSFPVTLTYTSALQAPGGYVFSEEIDASNFEATFTLQVYETTDDLPQIPLSLPDDVAFYLGAGLNYSPEMSLEEIASELDYFANACFYFLTEENREVYPSEIQWDLTDIIAGTPGIYTAKATFPFSPRYTLPQEVTPLSIPIHIRDDNSLEIYLDSVYSDFWGTVYYGGVYLPKNAEAIEGYLPGYFAYCGEDKPTAAQLDALTFTPAIEEDETIYFFEIYGYGYHSEYEDASIYIDLTCIPVEEQQGWYAFYVQTSGYTSNYILLNTKHPATLVDDVEGTRGGDSNSNFPDTEQEAPAGDSNPIVSATPAPTVSPITSATPFPTNVPATTTPVPTVAPVTSTTPVPTNVPATTTPVPTNVSATTTPTVAPAETSTPLPVLTEPWDTEAPASTVAPFMEQDTTDGMTLSAVRIQSLIQNNNALVVSKNGATAHFSTDALETLGLAENDFLSVRLTWPDEATLLLEVTINGFVPDTIPRIELTLQEVPYDTAQKQTITHESGASINCYENNGYMAFATNLTGCYAIHSEDITTMASESLGHPLPIAVWISIAVLVIAVTLLLFFLLQKSRRDKE
ncbi:MAG: hypothetical protein IJN16_09525 [Lachnospiraceae bacterium]|nr:hypothetical protein [Lachnospiraceae bacterium]